MVGANAPKGRISAARTAVCDDGLTGKKVQDDGGSGEQNVVLL
jgi:hypothetical protein